MSVAITEGDKSRQFGGVKYLRTKEVGGGTCDWVRLSARKLTTKRVKKNGTYKASAEKDKYGNSYFGFSTFTVAIKKKSTTGKRKDPKHPDDPDYDYETEVTEDDEGNLIEKDVPHHIKITTEPTKLNYKDKEKIDTKGMVVKAYLKNGELWEDDKHQGGVIPLKELKISPEKADYNAVEPSTVVYNKSELPSLNFDFNNPLIIVPNHQTGRFRRKVVNPEWQNLSFLVSGNEGDVYCAALRSEEEEGSTDDSKVNGHLIYVSEKPFKMIENWGSEGYVRNSNHYTYRFKGETRHIYLKPELGLYIDSKKSDAGRVEQIFLDKNYMNTSNPLSPADQATASIDIAKIILNSKITKGKQQITVKWNRPSDEKELTDTFGVDVTETSDNNNSDDNNNGAGDGAGGGGGGAW